MKLDYGTQLSPDPITLSIGTIRKPRLRDISKLTFELFSFYEFFLKLTPEIYYTKFKIDGGTEYWNNLTEEEQSTLTLYDLIEKEPGLQSQYVKILNFFFEESVIFQEGFFIILNQSVEKINDETDVSIIRGVISKETFPQVIGIIQQICCIYEEEENIDDLPFKNALARQFYEKMLKAKKKEKEEKKADKDLTIPNIISSVSNKHPSYNHTNIWDITIFQLLDSFNKLRLNTIYDIQALRVSVWGDEKKTFDSTLWHKNEYDKK